MLCMLHAVCKRVTYLGFEQIVQHHSTIQFAVALAFEQIDHFETILQWAHACPAHIQYHAWSNYRLFNCSALFLFFLLPYTLIFVVGFVLLVLFFFFQFRLL